MGLRKEEDSGSQYFNSDDDALYAMVNTESYNAGESKGQASVRSAAENVKTTPSARESIIAAALSGPATAAPKSRGNYQGGSFNFPPGMVVSPSQCEVKVSDRVVDLPSAQRSLSTSRRQRKELGHFPRRPS